MSIKAYYNEIEPYCCAWLSNLMDAGHITPGVIDDRSIEDVRPRDLDGFDRVHFFAGVGVWDYALTLAGWGARPVWSGSCPCQPFSAAGKGAGFDDERHLWPAMHHLIKECRPAVVFGEQVASSAVDPWIDLVCDDVEGLGYAFGAVPFPSAGVGAPHIRDRSYWVADAQGPRPSRGDGAWSRTYAQRSPAERGGAAGVLANTEQHGRRCQTAPADHGGAETVGSADRTGRCGGASGALADADNAGLSRFAGLRIQRPDLHDADGRGPVGGFWADADWIPCRDGKWRPVRPGSFPLAHGAPARVGRLRAYGNAVNAEAAAAFVRAAA